MSNIIGRYIQQPQGFKAFIPADFPPVEDFHPSRELISKHNEALRLLGVLDGITRFLPDKDLFLTMFIRKDASSSSAIEGTNATMEESIEYENIEKARVLPDDVDDILHYIKALNFGIEQSKTMPFSLRFIRELHSKLMAGARFTQNPYPGEFRRSQNWIGGTKPDNARFVPPPVHEMKRALGDLENFIHADDDFLLLIKAGLIHAQFETIHPFNDGNGRTGRMLITMFLLFKKTLDIPVLYLSAYFRKHQSLYYDKINNYHEGDIEEWLLFFLDGLIEVAESSIESCEKIIKLRDRDLLKIHKMSKRASASTMSVLTNLYTMPIVGIAEIASWTNTTKPGSYTIIQRMVDENILYPLHNRDVAYGQKWVYKDYLDIFS